MQALAEPTLAEGELSQWDDAPPTPFDEQEFDILAFELWQRANCPENAGEDWPGEEEAVRSHASCL